MTAWDQRYQEQVCEGWEHSEAFWERPRGTGNPVEPGGCWETGRRGGAREGRG